MEEGDRTESLAISGQEILQQAEFHVHCNMQKWEQGSRRSPAGEVHTVPREFTL